MLTWSDLAVVIPGAILVALIAIPIGALIARGVSHGDVLAALRTPFATTALWLSLLTSGISVVVAVGLGTPAAYLLARRSFPGRSVIDTLIDLPIVLPPVVGGLALLVALGPRGAIGQPLHAIGVDVAFTTGAVIVAQIFVSAPFYVRSARAGFEGVDRRLEAVSATLGAGSWTTFRRVTIPMAMPALVGGAVMCWARALGEFGATIMFAGNLAGRTQTMPLAILEAIETDVDAALALAIILIVIAVGILTVFKGLAWIGRPIQ